MIDETITTRRVHPDTTAVFRNGVMVGYVHCFSRSWGWEFQDRARSGQASTRSVAIDAMIAAVSR